MTEKYELIEVELSDKDKVLLVERFVKTKLSGASQSTFIVEGETKCVEDALFQAVVNEMILEALIEEIEHTKTETRVFMTPNEIERSENILSQSDIGC